LGVPPSKPAVPGMPPPKPPAPAGRPTVPLKPAPAPAGAEAGPQKAASPKRKLRASRCRRRALRNPLCPKPPSRCNKPNLSRVPNPEFNRCPPAFTRRPCLCSK
jgi:hypothetical protein